MDSGEYELIIFAERVLGHVVMTKNQGVEGAAAVADGPVHARAAV
jgi:hypothetical protein